MDFLKIKLDGFYHLMLIKTDKLTKKRKFCRTRNTQHRTDDVQRRVGKQAGRSNIRDELKTPILKSATKRLYLSSLTCKNRSVSHSITIRIKWVNICKELRSISGA